MGYFIKMAKADTFVYHDAVTLNTRGYTRRCYIKPQAHGENQRLSVSLKSASQNQLISEVYLYPERKWQEEHWQSIQHTYQQSEYFAQVSPWIYDLILNNKVETLVDYNIAILSALATYLELDCTFVKSSSLNFEGDTTDQKHLSLITLLGGTHYVSGIGSRAYQDEVKYIEQGVRLTYLESLSLLQTHVDSNRAQLSILDYLFDYSQAELITLIKQLAA